MPAGVVHGLIGGEGSGKTTCLRLLATLLMPDEGSIVIDERHTATHIWETRRATGYVPDTFGNVRGLTVREYLDFYGSCAGLPRKRRRRRLGEALGLTGLGGREGGRVEELSREDRRRLLLAKAVLHEPRVLLVDEPRGGMDPRVEFELAAAISRVASGGAAVVVASSTVAGVERLCSQASVLDGGRLLRSGSVDELLQAACPRVVWSLRLAGEPGLVASRLAHLEYVADVRVTGDGLRICLDQVQMSRRGLSTESIPPEVIRVVLDQGLRLMSVTSVDEDARDPLARVIENLPG
ncbi:MAG: ABC transporter ATP-binding protein [Lentisphaeria bacterium]|nr:ABC transporter ATP-binding protein [Lentisphaeria bacterium]